MVTVHSARPPAVKRMVAVVSASAQENEPRSRDVSNGKRSYSLTLPLPM
jgi:hypothetical protein